MKKWRYHKTTGIIKGIGHLPNGFAENELHPIQTDIIQEDIPNDCNPPIHDTSKIVTRTTAGKYKTTDVQQ